MEMQKWKVKLKWIKAQAGHQGNELADKMRKRQLPTEIATSAAKGFQKVE